VGAKTAHLSRPDTSKTFGRGCLDPVSHPLGKHAFPAPAFAPPHPDWSVVGSVFLLIPFEPTPFYSSFGLGRSWPPPLTVSLATCCSHSFHLVSQHTQPFLILSTSFFSTLPSLDCGFTLGLPRYSLPHDTHCPHHTHRILDPHRILDTHRIIDTHCILDTLIFLTSHSRLVSSTCINTPACIISILKHEYTSTILSIRT
jgi:hypothetical protein